MIADLIDLASVVRAERDTLMARWREQVRRLPSARGLDAPTLNDHVPLFIDTLCQALEAQSEDLVEPPALALGPPIHGAQRVEDGFDIEEVVIEYTILRAVIHDLAGERGLGLRGRSAQILNGMLDRAIGTAVKGYAARSAQAAQARREEYLAFLAHDLRTPLNAIYLATRVLDAQLGGEGAGAQPILKVLRRNVQQLDALVSQVIEESTSLQPDSGLVLQRRLFDLWPLVEALHHDLQPLAERAGARLINDVPHDLVVYADAGLLRRVLQNLLSNAITYAPGGKVVIGACASEPRGGVDCWVADDGQGIPPERLPVIFDKMETDPHSEDGLGLGLAIVKAFVEAHDGTVGVESAPGKGSTFTMWLPDRPAPG